MSRKDNNIIKRKDGTFEAKYIKDIINNITNIINKYFDNVNISLEKDYSGRDRFVFIWNH